MRGRRDGAIPSEVPEWLVAEGVTPGTLEEAFLVSTGRGVIEWIMFGATAVPTTFLLGEISPEDVWPLWATIIFGTVLVSLLWLSLKFARATAAQTWISSVGVKPSDDMVMALTAESLLIWNRSLWERTPHRLILQRSRQGLSGKRCWGLFAFELTTADGHRLTFHTDAPTSAGSDRLLAKLNDSPIHAG